MSIFLHLMHGRISILTPFSPDSRGRARKRISIYIHYFVAFHLTMAPGSIAPALVASVLWILVFLQYRESFNSIFNAKPATQA